MSGSVGPVVGLAGFAEYLNSAPLAAFLALAIPIVGAILINVPTDPPGKDRQARRWSAPRDRAFVGMTLIF